MCTVHTIYTYLPRYVSGYLCTLLEIQGRTTPYQTTQGVTPLYTPTRPNHQPYSPNPLPKNTPYLPTQPTSKNLKTNPIQKTPSIPYPHPTLFLPFPVFVVFVFIKSVTNYHDSFNSHHSHNTHILPSPPSPHASTNPILLDRSIRLKEIGLYTALEEKERGATGCPGGRCVGTNMKQEMYKSEGRDGIEMGWDGRRGEMMGYEKGKRREIGKGWIPGELSERTKEKGFYMRKRGIVVNVFYCCQSDLIAQIISPPQGFIPPPVPPPLSLPIPAHQNYLTKSKVQNARRK